MKAVSLKEFVKEHGQTEAAKHLGLTQGAIWQMLRANRKVSITEVHPGHYEATELKPVGRKGKR